MAVGFAQGKQHVAAEQEAEPDTAGSLALTQRLARFLEVLLGSW